MADRPDETIEREPVEADVEPAHNTSNFLAVREALAAQLQKGANWFFWMSVAFHAFCLWCIFGGLRASRQLKALDEAIALEAD